MFNGDHQPHPIPPPPIAVYFLPSSHTKKLTQRDHHEGRRNTKSQRVAFLCTVDTTLLTCAQIRTNTSYNEEQSVILLILFILQM